MRFVFDPVAGPLVQTLAAVTAPCGVIVLFARSSPIVVIVKEFSYFSRYCYCAIEAPAPDLHDNSST